MRTLALATVAQAAREPVNSSGAVVPWTVLVIGVVALTAVAVGLAIDQRRRRQRSGAASQTSPPAVFTMNQNPPPAPVADAASLGANGWPSEPPTAVAPLAGPGPVDAAAPAGPGSGWPSGPPMWPPTRPDDLPGAPEA